MTQLSNSLHSTHPEAQASVAAGVLDSDLPSELDGSMGAGVRVPLFLMGMFLLVVVAWPIDVLIGGMSLTLAAARGESRAWLQEFSGWPFRVMGLVEDLWSWVLQGET